jgi:hypothetical protein
MIGTMMGATETSQASDIKAYTSSVLALYLSIAMRVRMYRHARHLLCLILRSL